MKQVLPLAPGMKIGYVIKDAHRFGANTFSTEFSNNAPHFTDIYVHKLNVEALLH